MQETGHGDLEDGVYRKPHDGSRAALALDGLEQNERMMCRSQQEKKKQRRGPRHTEREFMLKKGIWGRSTM